MAEWNPVSQAEYEFFLHLLKEQHYEGAHEIVAHSQMFTEGMRDLILIHTGMARDLYLHTDPYVFARNYGKLNTHRDTIKRVFQDVSTTEIRYVHIVAEVEKFVILNNPVKTVVTPWSTINKYQEILIDQLKNAEAVVQFENIGNTSRKLLKALADEVFKPDRHKADGVKLGSENVKNRLQTYIRCEVGDTEQNEEFIACLDSLIDAAESTVALSNKIVHDSKGYKVMAESCVISVVTVVHLFKIIDANKKPTE